MRRKNNDNFLIILSLIITGIIVYYLYTITNNDIIIVNNINKRIPRAERYNRGRDGPGKRHYSNRINIRTRGEPDEYQTVGILKKEDSDDVIPLIGRQTYPGSNSWNYFTMTDSHLKTEIPIKKERNCTDVLGCTEIQTDDTVNFLGNNYSVDMYPYNELRYLPY